MEIENLREEKSFKRRFKRRKQNIALINKMLVLLNYQKNICKLPVKYLKK